MGILEWTKSGITMECDAFCWGLLKDQKENVGDLLASVMAGKF